MKRFFIAPTRSRIVQISVVAMSLALFIMMRKLTGEGSVRSERPSDRMNPPEDQASAGERRS